MGGWAIFCAICGGPFSSQVDMDCEGTDERAYRYDMLEDCNLDWLDELQALGMNPDATGSDKSFLTGAGRYWDCGQINVVAGEDANTPFPKNEVVPMVAYHDFSEIGLPYVFPFHSVCYELLQKCISLRHPGEIRGDILYNVFEEVNSGRYIRLHLDYGDPEPPAEQVWETIRGQEILVVDPVTIPAVQSEVRAIECLLDTKCDVHETKRAGKDIFNRLPIELRHEIFKGLSPESILALKAASWAMHSTSLPGRLWTAKLVDGYPWLWEVHRLDVFESQELEGRASRLLRTCQENCTYTGNGDDCILGLANRRRIWGVCEQIRSRYLEHLSVLT